MCAACLVWARRRWSRSMEHAIPWASGTEWTDIGLFSRWTNLIARTKTFPLSSSLRSFLHLIRLVVLYLCTVSTYLYLISSPLTFVRLLQISPCSDQSMNYIQGVLLPCNMTCRKTKSKKAKKCRAVST